MPPRHPRIDFTAHAVRRLRERGPLARRAGVAPDLSDAEAGEILEEIVNRGRLSKRPPRCVRGVRAGDGQSFAHYHRRPGIVPVIRDGAITTVYVADKKREEDA